MMRGEGREKALKAARGGGKRWGRGGRWCRRSVGEGCCWWKWSIFQLGPIPPTPTPFASWCAFNFQSLPSTTASHQLGLVCLCVCNIFGGVAALISPLLPGEGAVAAGKCRSAAGGRQTPADSQAAASPGEASGAEARQQP